MDLLEHIDDLCRKVHKSTERINAGGCAIFASFMAQCLEKYGPVSIAVGTDESPVSIDKARKHINSNEVHEWNKRGIYFAHVVVEFEYQGVKYHIDSTGVHDEAVKTHLGHFQILKGRLTVQEVTELASCDKGWNWCFDRKQIPMIKRMIDQGFKKIFKQEIVPTH